jgi:hypothetical protein
MVCALAACGLASAQGISDDFNRADGTDMGPNWSEYAGDYFRIEANHGRCNGGNRWMDWIGTANTLPYYQVVASIDAFATPTGVNYVALRTGVNGLTDELFIKIQEQSPYTGFNYIGFYHRTSSTGFGAWTGGAGFTALPAMVTEGRITTYFLPGDTDKIYVDIDTDFNGTPEYTMSSAGVNNIAANLGYGVGIGGYGSAGVASADFDNWVAPEPASLALLAVLGLLRRR